MEGLRADTEKEVGPTPGGPVRVNTVLGVNCI